MDWIRQHRKRLGYSQEDMARMLQLDGFSVVRSTVGHWESGHAVPPLGDSNFVRSLAKILRVDSTTLLQMAGYDIITQHNEIAERAARLIDSMSEEKQHLALRLVEQLLDNGAGV